MPAWRALTLAVLIGLLAGGWCLDRYYSARTAALERSLAAAQADAKALRAAAAAKHTALSRLRAAHRQQKENLTHALQANTEWATGRVPDPVFNSVFGPRLAAPAP